MPALLSSPATLTCTSTSTSSRRLSADSDATEWIRRTRGATSRTLRDCSAPMKSQVNRSPCASCFSASCCARFSPTSVTPPSARAGRSSTSRYLTAASTSTSGPMASRTRSRFVRTRSASIADHHARLTAGHPPVAAVGEEQLRVAARAQVNLGDLAHPLGLQLLAGDRAQVEVGLAGAAEGGRHLLAHLETAWPDAGTDGGGRRPFEPLERPPDDPAGQAAPAAVQHCDQIGGGKRHGQEVVPQDQQPEPALARQVAVDLGR